MANTVGYLKATAKYHQPPIPQLKFSDAEQFKTDVDAFFSSISLCEKVKDEKGNFIPDKYHVRWIKPPTIVGLANYLGCDYRIFQDYEDDKYINHPQMTKSCLDSLKHTLARARQICHEYTLGALFTQKSAQGPIFALKTVYKDHGYSDEFNITHSTKIDEKTVKLEQLDTDDLIKLEEIMCKTLEIKGMQATAEEIEFEEIESKGTGSVL